MKCDGQVDDCAVHVYGPSKYLPCPLKLVATRKQHQWEHGEDAKEVEEEVQTGRRFKSQENQVGGRKQGDNTQLNTDVQTLGPLNAKLNKFKVVFWICELQKKGRHGIFGKEIGVGGSRRCFFRCRHPATATNSGGCSAKVSWQ